MTSKPAGSLDSRAGDRPGWNGIILVANTPFAEDGSLDLEGIPSFADYLAKAGCEAALLRGVAAETAYLDRPNASFWCAVSPKRRGTVST